MGETIEIRKKNKTIVIVFAVIFLLAIGGIAIWALTSFVFPKLLGFWKLELTAIVIIAAVVIAAIYVLMQQTISKKPGLIIDERGITDNSNITSVGLIAWSDISAVQEAANEFKQKMIIVVVRNPEAYINKTNKMRESRQIQYKQFGSPIVISASNLEYDTKELISMLSRRIASAAQEDK